MKLNFADPTQSEAPVQAWSPVRSEQPARMPEAELSELDLQCWELWALSTSDAVWLAGVTAAVSLWVLLF